MKCALNGACLGSATCSGFLLLLALFFSDGGRVTESGEPVGEATGAGAEGDGSFCC